MFVNVFRGVIFLDLINPIELFLTYFGNEALITICLLLAIGKAIEINRSLEPLVGFLRSLLVVGVGHSLRANWEP